MTAEELRELFEDKYQHRLNLTFTDWLRDAPRSEGEAYRRLAEIDGELKGTYDRWYQAVGEERERLDGYRERLKANYDLLEELFGLESNDE